MAHTSGIGSSQVLQSLLGQSDRVAAAKKDVATESVAATRSSDSAEFSSVASSLSQVAAGSSTDDVRTAKVAAIQSAIAAGTYSVPSDAVADKLIQHLLG